MPWARILRLPRGDGNCRLTPSAGHLATPGAGPSRQTTLAAPARRQCPAMHPRPDTALALSRQRWLRRAPTIALLLAAVCTAIAVMLTLASGGAFRYRLLYSCCIGLACVAINDGGSLLHAWLHDRWRAWRGLAPSAAGWDSGWAGVWPSTVACVLLGPPIGQKLADAITGFNSPPIYNLASRNTQVTLFVSLLATLAIVGVISSRERLASAKAQAEAAERAAAENQLKLLQSQLEPHMLFNTLANLRVLIGLDAAAAQQMLDRLIAFLRATLEASRLPAHPLATEYARVADYLALMAIRMGPRLQVVLDLPPGLAAQPVPPLLLQPLVENAIKHGLEPHVAGGRLVVSAHADGEMLVLQVRDTGIGLAQAATATAGTRFGLAQVRERLATLHGARASLVVAPAPDADGGTVATIQLPRTAVPVAAPATLPTPTP
jgi:signal transduction histidine kinase